MLERFTTSAREVVARARGEAQRADAGYIGTEHILMALLDPAAGVAYDVLHAAGVRLAMVRAEAARATGKQSGRLGADDAEALKTIGIDLDAVVASVERSFGEGALDAPVPSKKWGRVPFTNRAKKVLELSVREAVSKDRGRIGAVRLSKASITSEHILLGLIREGEGLATKILTGAGVNLDDLRSAVLASPPRAA